MGPGNIGLGLFTQLQKFQVKCIKGLKTGQNGVKFFFGPSHIVNNNISGIFLFSIFLDPIGSLVSTLLVSGLWVVVGHTFSKLVNFECVGMLECWCVGVL